MLGSAQWQSYTRHLLDLIFPPVCVHCQRVGSLFCAACWGEIIPPPASPAPPPELDGIYALALHQGGIREALHALKYESQPDLGPILGRTLADQLQWTFDAIIPVPLHFSRLKERGYNQATMIAQGIATQSNRPLLPDVLARQQATRTQVGLSAAERRANVADAFELVGLAPPAILLVDDVCTTGATLSAAAVALRQGGVQTIYAATVSLAS